MADSIQVWDLWYPKAGATGMSFARCRIDARDEVWVHAVPPHLTVQIRDDSGQILAEGTDLAATGESPLTHLRREGTQIFREDRWPGPDDLGKVVVLPGGEAGILVSWWHAPDHSEWRWQVEFYNRVAS